ncbi:hypothetical protein EVAR_73894_1 [Eumeta japonica]|uniref:Uncharacterized protein n=1 Tax=Eumeta variegata TaxID=151549 RepID=A0A4C1TGD4_EUMVA|nr:hypothetical protein EVAR_73894_1 [Eumeta japonica]
MDAEMCHRKEFNTDNDIIVYTVPRVPGTPVRADELRKLIINYMVRLGSDAVSLASVASGYLDVSPVSEGISPGRVHDTGPLSGVYTYINMTSRLAGPYRIELLNYQLLKLRHQRHTQNELLENLLLCVRHAASRVLRHSCAGARAQVENFQEAGESRPQNQRWSHKGGPGRGRGRPSSDCHSRMN